MKCWVSGQKRFLKYWLLCAPQPSLRGEGIIIHKKPLEDEG